MRRAANAILVTSSTLLSFLIVNQALVFASTRISQRNGFPRKYLRYFDPVARWKYPDYNNSDTKRDATYIVGDSYAEGAGDLFLSNKYSYSIGHFLDDKWRKNTNIYLAANSGSSIPSQLFLLEKHLSGKLSPLSTPVKAFENLNIVLYFYEGNDLENTVSSKLLSFDSLNSWRRLNLPILYGGRMALSMLKDRLSLSKPRSFVKSKTNKICIGTTCRYMPSMQSASAGLTEKQISQEISYLINSITKFSLEYPKARICFVYIPSPLTIYSPKGRFYYQRYSSHTEIADPKTDSESNGLKSLFIREALRNRLDLLSIPFIDPTKDLKARSRKGFLHGDIDPKHFNAYGYKLIADATMRGCAID